MKEEKMPEPMPYETAIGTLYPVCYKCGETRHKYFHKNSIIGALIGIDLTPETLDCLKCYYGDEWKEPKNPGVIV